MPNINQWKTGDIISASRLNEMVDAINNLMKQQVPEIDTSNLITTQQLSTILEGYSDVGHTHNISEIVDLVLPTKTSQLTNDSGYVTDASVDEKVANAFTNQIPQLKILSLVLGNYEIKYNSTDDTLDFLFNGAIDEPTKETVALTWAIGNLDSSGAEIVQENSLRSDFVAIETGYTYSFNLGTSMYDPTDVRVYFYDTNRAFISRTDGGALGYTTGTDISIDVPTNAAYMRFKCNVGGTTTLNNINTLFTLTKANDEIVIPTWHDGKSIAGATGEIIVNEAAMVTDPIAIDNNYNYAIRYNPTTNLMRLE